MDSVVLKFGGTSVQDAAALRRLVAVVGAEPRRRVVVVSALARVTDTLAEIAMGTVEIAPLLEAGRVPVLGGFVGSTKAGVTTTLGRGGSDYSAALVGAAIAAREIQIWTDVDGVLTSDPRVVSSAALVPELTFHEAYDLARFGAKVLHWGTLEPAASHDIPVRVLNSRRPGAGGTTIAATVRRAAPSVVGLAHQSGHALVCVTRRALASRVLSHLHEMLFEPVHA